MAARAFTSADKMKTLIAQNPLLLMAMSRFGISLGFGEKYVADICREHSVDCQTFLAVANFITFQTEPTGKVSVEALMHYLKNAHSYYLDFCLPLIRRRLIESIDCSGGDEVAMMILKFYDEYTSEVHRHMEYENNTVFSYVARLLDGHCDPNYSISVFASGHQSIDTKLNELKEIIIRYLPQRDNNLLNSVLFDIINCRQDLIAHCAVEDRIFVPAVLALEDKTQNSDTHNPSNGDTTADGDDNELTNRERHIIACVAQGMSNKEIADRLCISVHTVTTHRRNIANKLQIHSSAGLAIYAVINGLITLEQ